MENSEPYFYDDVVWFRDHPGRAYRVRRASKAEVKDFLAIYREANKCALEPSPLPAYALVRRIGPFRHKKLIRWIETDCSNADEITAKKLFEYAWSKPITIEEHPLQ